MASRRLARSVLATAAALAATLLPAAAADAGLPAYVVDAGARTVYAVDTTSGTRTAVSTGDRLSDPTGIAIEADGRLVVSDAGAGGVIRVDPDTGVQTLLSTSSDFGTPTGIAVRPGGGLVVTDSGSGGLLTGLLFSQGALIGVNATTGATTVLAYDDRFGNPAGVTVGAAGALLVADPDGPTPAGAIVRVDGSTSVQSIAAQGGTFSDPSGVAVESAGTLLVADPRGPSSGEIQRVTGTTPAVVATGGVLDDPRGIAVEHVGTALVADPAAGALVRIDPDSGGQTILRDDFTTPVAVALPDDADGDGTAELHDTCPGVANPSQVDTDGDSLGDACDPTPDGTPVPGVGTGNGNGNANGADKEKDKKEKEKEKEQGRPDKAGDGAKPAGGSETQAPPLNPTVNVSDLTAAAPTPVLGSAVAVRPSSGRVSVRLPGATADTPLGRAGELPVGATVDTTAGAVVLTSALPGGRLQSARFSGGRFRIEQRRSDGVTDVRLTGGAPACARSTSTTSKTTARAAAAKKTSKKKKAKRLPHLWGDGHGRFRTHGRHAVATVRGTRWLVEETCRGTAVRVARGLVSVRDKRTGRTRLLRAGERYVTGRR